MPRSAHRKDATEREIVRALRGIGWRVESLSDWGYTVDLLVLVGDDVYLVDAKSHPKAPLTASQQMLVADGWPIIFAVDGQDAIDQIAERRSRYGKC